MANTSDFTALDRADLILESPPGPYKNEFPLPPTRRPTRVLGTFSVVAIAYLYGCGGPLGTESIVAAAGPLLGLLGFVLFPIVYTLPYAGVVTELSAAFPEDGGFAIWVLNAFGPFWALQVGWWSWIAGAVSIAMYPDYVLDVVTRAAGGDLEIHAVFAVKTAIALLLSLPVVLGTRSVSRLALVTSFGVLVPVVAFVAFGLGHTTTSGVETLGVVRRANVTIVHHRHETGDDVAVVEQQGDAEIDWFDWINTLYWNYEGLRMASVFGGQVANPAAVYRKAIWLVVGLTALTYIAPLVATVLSDRVPWPEWTRGTYEVAARALGGRALHVLMVACSGMTCLGLFVCGAFCISTEISGMAENRLLPQALATRSPQFGSPHYALGATVGLSIGLMAVPFDDLLPVANTFGNLVAVTIFLAAVALRRSMPYVPRPARVPGGVVALVALSLVPVGLCAYIIVMTVTRSLTSALMVLGFLAPPMLYGWYRVHRYETLLYR